MARDPRMWTRVPKVAVVAVVLLFGFPAPFTGSPVPSASLEPPTCFLAAPYVKKWQAKLGLQHYEIILKCEALPEVPLMLGASRSSIEQRKMELYLKPDLERGKIEEVVLHELLHTLMSNMIQSKSDEIHEQTVRTLVKVIL